MNFTYKYRSVIARITLVAIFSILLLVMNYQILDSSYAEGSFEESIFRNAEDIEQCIVFNDTKALNINERISRDHNIFVHIDFIHVLGKDYFYLVVAIFILFLIKGYVCADTKYTLVSLCVRMDD